MSLCIGQRLVFGAVNGVVFADIQIIRFLRNIQIAAVRNVGVIFVRGRSDTHNLRITLRLFCRFLCPVAGDNICCRTVLCKVHGNHRKLGGAAALQEQNAVIVRYTDQFAEILLGFLDDPVINFSAVAHLHHGHP